MNSLCRASRFSMRCFLNARTDVDPLLTIGAFQRWIKEKKLPGERPIDVVDYSHVPGGPGVLLAMQGGSYGFEETGGILGLRYTSGRGRDDALRVRIHRTFIGMLDGVDLIRRSDELGTLLSPVTDRFEFAIYDRRHAPNDVSTLRAMRPTLDEFFGRVFRRQVQILHLHDDGPFRVIVKRR